MIIALDKYTGYMFTSSPNRMMSSSVAMEILCITIIDSISFKKIAGVDKIAVNMSDSNIFYRKLAEIFEMYW